MFIFVVAGLEAFYLFKQHYHFINEKTEAQKVITGLGPDKLWFVSELKLEALCPVTLIPAQFQNG